MLLLDIIEKLSFDRRPKDRREFRYRGQPVDIYKWAQETDEPMVRMRETRHYPLIGDEVLMEVTEISLPRTCAYSLPTHETQGVTVIHRLVMEHL